jgi:hypothetical protein
MGSSLAAHRRKKPDLVFQSMVQPYRGFLIEVDVVSGNRYGATCYVGAFMVSDSAGNVAGHGKTPIAPAYDIADRLAFSMALDVVDRWLRRRLC